MKSSLYNSYGASTWQPPKKAVTKRLKCIVLGGAGAGKTSILRRYFHGNFDIARMPTLGSDFYSRNIPDPSEDPGDPTEEQPFDEKKETSSDFQTPNRILSMQVWDTPGRERFAADRKPIYTAAFADNFFKNVDAALLVYDITSSTSFTHVLKWHADLVERIRRLEATGERTRPFPVLIVANKMDILKQETRQFRQQAVVAQRDVMGLAGRAFRGKDYRYEYSASPLSPSYKSSSSSSSKNLSKKMRRRDPRNRFEISTYMGTGDQTSYLEAVLNNQVRGSYLESLLISEDGSHPDKEMVVLWCMRNGLKHMEVSALDGTCYCKRLHRFVRIDPHYFKLLGTGIDELIRELVKVALESANYAEKVPSADSKKMEELQRNDELDLHRRYAPKETGFLRLPFQGCFKPY